MNQLSEAEVAGDDSVVRSLLTKLQDRTLFPPKVFIFHEDARPGYYGTWTRSSRIIGPRRPLARDMLVFDYNYDSGEEWEEEPQGENVDEEDEDEEDVDDADSDADSWLVDDDEEVDVPSLGDLDSLDPPDIWDLPMPLPKRKADDGEKREKGMKKRKIVVPLVPFAKGPCYEERIGECSYEAFQSYRIQLFNDTPYPIDPFSYVSTCIEDHRAHVKAMAAAANPAPLTEDGFAVPQIPARFANASSTLPALDASTSSSSMSGDAAIAPGQPATTAAKKLANPKHPFPDAHLPYLLKRISELEASSVVLLVETIYEGLKPNKVTKAAVEAKVREVGEKCKVKKKWVVKPAYQTLVCSFLISKLRNMLNPAGRLLLEKYNRRGNCKFM